jgi:hypothetical protein
MKDARRTGKVPVLGRLFADSVQLTPVDTLKLEPNVKVAITAQDMRPGTFVDWYLGGECSHHLVQDLMSFV